MKVLFLDIDGVLNKDSTKETIEVNGAFFTALCPKLTALYLEWRRAKDFEVVLSSSWRGYEDAKEHLRQAGVTWFDQTRNLPTTSRGDEINDWVIRNRIEEFAILDDMNTVHPLARHLVQTSSRKGIEEKHLKKVEKLLNLHSGE